MKQLAQNSRNLIWYDVEIKPRYTNVIVAAVSNASGRHYIERYRNAGKRTSSWLFNHHMQSTRTCKSQIRLYNIVCFTARNRGAVLSKYDWFSSIKIYSKQQRRPDYNKYLPCQITNQEINRKISTYLGTYSNFYFSFLCHIIMYLSHIVIIFSLPISISIAVVKKRKLKDGIRTSITGWWQFSFPLNLFSTSRLLSYVTKYETTLSHHGVVNFILRVANEL